ncbi:MAG: 2,3,4,5-tetrahydropyridine-2,6-dicarboxylate N-succinyltransferase [Gammaproteobacteria bacterium]|nr:2,3,4,5-tetrahydropyridine-2,6-dicarboxylate N-succinyltransferase [Gammaproteobacteria bacterium]
MEAIRRLIDDAFARRTELAPGRAPADLLAALDDTLALLEAGTVRVAEPAPDGWRVNEWLKKAVLLWFRTHDSALLEAGVLRFFDKLPLRHSQHDAARFAAEGVRVVPGAIVRRGSYIAPNAVLMPCFVNVGAWIGAGTMVDTWATVGSCAQIGRNVHLSGGVGIGGVLEPLQAQPVIIEDDCFIGARSEVVEGVVVERGAVLSMGVFLGASTRIFDRESGTISYGRVPAGAVVVPGSLPAADGSHSLACAVIVKRVDAQTRAKTSINELLRM